jgi:hypothetical protein
MTWRRKHSWPYQDSNSDSAVVQTVPSRYKDCPEKNEVGEKVDEGVRRAEGKKRKRKLQEEGHATAQTVSRRLPTAAARVRAYFRSRGICGGQSDAGAGFLRVLQFPLPIHIPPTVPQSLASIVWGRYNGPQGPQYQAGSVSSDEKK